MTRYTFLLATLFTLLTHAGAAYADSTPSAVGAYDARLSGVVADGATDDAASVNNAIAAAEAGGFGTIQLPCGRIKVNTAINLTNDRGTGITLRGCGWERGYGIGPDGGPWQSYSTQILCNTYNASTNPSGVCVDTTGATSLTVQFMEFRTSRIYSNPSRIIILMGRDDARHIGARDGFCYAQANTFDHIYIETEHSSKGNINGQWGYIGFYNLNAEEGLIHDSVVIADTDYYFASSNDLHVSSPSLPSGVTLQTNCSYSMTSWTFLHTYGMFQSGTGAVFVGSGSVDNIHFVGGGSYNGVGHTGNAFVITGGGEANNWYIRGQYEGLTCTGNNGALIASNNNLNNFDVDVTVSAGKNSCSDGYIQMNKPGTIIRDSHFKVNVLNMAQGTPPPLLTNSSYAVKSSEFYLATTARPASFSQIVLSDGDRIVAAGFTDDDLTIPAGSNVYLSDDSGQSFWAGDGQVKFQPRAGTLALLSGTQSYVMSCAGQAAPNATVWLQDATQPCTVSNAVRGLTIASAGTMRNLAVRCHTPGRTAASGVFTVADLGTLQTLSCTLGTATTCSDTEHAFPVSAGDWLQVQIQTQPGETLGDCSVSVEKQ